MKNKNYPLLICIFLILSFTFIANVFAHPGRTDQNGGHWDRKAGTYHYHSGEYAGKGGGSAPATTNKPTASNSLKRKAEERAKIIEEKYGNSTYGSTADLNENRTGTKENTPKKLSVIETIIFLIVLSPYVFGLFYLLFGLVALLYYSLLEKHLPRYKINLLQEKINEFQRNQDEIYANNLKILNLKKQYQIPDLYEIGTDNLPKDKNSVSYWGKSFTVYKTDKGIKLHAKYNCCSATKPFHIYQFRNYRYFSQRLCSKCANNYVIPDLSWYDNHLKYKQVVATRQRLKKNHNNLQKEIKILHKKCNSVITKFLIIFSKKNKEFLRETNNKYKEIQTGN